MEAHVNDTRSKLGELAVMAKQTEQAERKILTSATEQLEKVQSELRSMHGKEMSGAERYMHLIAEQGRLQQVIAQARQVLAA